MVGKTRRPSYPYEVHLFTSVPVNASEAQTSSIISSQSIYRTALGSDFLVSIERPGLAEPSVSVSVSCPGVGRSRRSKQAGLMSLHSIMSVGEKCRRVHRMPHNQITPMKLLPFMLECCEIGFCWACKHFCFQGRGWVEGGGCYRFTAVFGPFS